MAPTQLQLRERLAELISEHGVPGASVSVLVGSEITDAEAGVVNVRTGVEVGRDSPFMIQSTTKVWTATLVMQLVDEGLVELDLPVARYLSGFRTADQRASSAITVRQLLTHTGGFEGDIWAPTSSGEDALERFVTEHVSQAAQHAEPGRFFSYCSAGMGVLGRVIEVLRGTTYNQALRRYLTDPLGLDEVVVDVGEAPAYRTAIGHVSAGPGAPTASAADLGGDACLEPGCGQPARNAGTRAGSVRADAPGGRARPRRHAAALGRVGPPDART